MKSMITAVKDEKDTSFALPQNTAGAWLAYALIFSLFIPLVILVVGDRGVWDWDLAIYGQQSVELYNLLLRSPAHWLLQMFTLGYDRPPAIAWFGQIFVPLDQSINSVQSGLLFLTLSTELLSVLLLATSSWLA